jgi:orotidine-5'-phosphate decarboxylase
MPENFADKLCDAVLEKDTRAIVGIDPRVELLPSDLQSKCKTPSSTGAAFLSFGKSIIDAAGPHVCAIKIQSAFYEALGLEGVKNYAETLAYAREKDIITIGDVKRGDIGSTVRAYAAGHLTPGSDFEADAVTVNPYLGYDGIEPFIEICAEHGKGIFILLRTSNPTAKQIQDVGDNDSPVWERLTVLISEWGKALTGSRGYSSVGAVVGATYPQEAVRARELAPHTILLMPGYGAQGGKASAITGCMDKDGLGAVIPSSRGVIYAFRDSDGKEAKNWKKSIGDAAEAMRNDVNQK